MVDVLLFGMTRGKDTVRKLRMAYVCCDLHMRWCFSQGVESCFLGVNLSYYYTFSIITHYIHLYHVLSFPNPCSPYLVLLCMGLYFHMAFPAS